MTTGRRLMAFGGLVVLLAGCSAESPAAPPVASHTVNLPRSYRFEPEAITVPAGTTVTWTNNDNFTHNVDFGDDTEALLMRPTESVSRTFSAPGSYDYVCSLHPADMQGSVVVTED